MSFWDEKAVERLFNKLQFYNALIEKPYIKLLNSIYLLPQLRFYNTAKNTVISDDFLVWKFCGKARFLHGFGWFARNYAETVLFRKISTPENQVKLRYFSQCNGWNIVTTSKAFRGYPRSYSIEITDSKDPSV